MGIVFAKLSGILTFLPIVLALYLYYRNGSDLKLRILVSIFIFWGFIESIILYLSNNKINNHFWLNINCIITTILFLIYYFVLNEFNRRMLYCSLGLYSSFSLMWFCFYGSLLDWAIPYIIISNIILIALSAYSLMQLINREQEDLFGFYEFWIHAGVLVYFTGSILYLSIFRIMLKSNDFTFNSNLQDVHSIINSIGNLLYTIAFICLIRNYKRKYILQ